MFLTRAKKAIAQQVSLTVSPPILKIYIKPGISIMATYQVENTGDPTIIQAKVLPFEPKDILGNVQIQPEFEGPIRFNLDNVNLALNQPFFMKTKDIQQLLLRIRVPDGTPTGDYYYSLLAETQEAPVTEGTTTVRAKVTVGSNILITVTDSGLIDVKGKISLFDVMASHTFTLFGEKINLFDSNDPVPVTLVINNYGKNLIMPSGEIVLLGNFGEKATYKIVSQNVLSQSQRLLTATPSAKIDCINKDVKQAYCRKPISFLISGFFVGLYKISTAVNFGDNSSEVYASTSFLAIPFKLIIGFSLALSIVIIILKQMMKN